jgi:hypothetical protein
MTPKAAMSARANFSGAASQVSQPLPRRPPMPSHSIGIFSAGTMRASSPRWVPSQTTRQERVRSSRARASAG